MPPRPIKEIGRKTRSKITHFVSPPRRHIHHPAIKTCIHPSIPLPAPQPCASFLIPAPSPLPLGRPPSSSSYRRPELQSCRARARLGAGSVREPGANTTHPPPPLQTSCRSSGRTSSRNVYPPSPS
ncbi:hypothetical protein BT67DRAFT_295670 [Trichocladium antarcticum]|uniref:Uncharacterized protein n=1 Tax=Trichocladium antarcticum TaxID=1450529 RepID=A0AAN6UKQ9_9PEZI|nr:hypothetical protein BT67DRAFT_295670 [Trichocladium antarcticum]